VQASVFHEYHESEGRGFALNLLHFVLSATVCGAGRGGRVMSVYVLDNAVGHRCSFSLYPPLAIDQLRNTCTALAAKFLFVAALITSLYYYMEMDLDLGQ
jgi:hypothetical protein